MIPTTMRYNIREKFWSWGDDFHILDESGTPVYFVDGAAFSWGSKLSFQDMAGNELAFIEQKLFSFLPHYRIHRDGELFAEVLKEFTAHELNEDRAVECFLQMCHALSDKINAKLTRNCILTSTDNGRSER